MLKSILIAAAAITFAACGHKALKPAASGTVYGQPFDYSATSLKNVEDFLASGADTVATEGVISGKILAVCQSAGCWMHLALPDGKYLFTDFQHKFFLPKDVAGKEVIVNGTTKILTVSVERQKHLAEDAGKSKEEIDAITQPSREVHFIASGVIIR